jgi:nucleotide-binding universal stress UspA family protein
MNHGLRKRKGYGLVSIDSRAPVGRGADGGFAVLVAVDGSKASNWAIQYAATLNADRIVLLQVVAAEEPTDVGSHLDAYTRWYKAHISAVRDDLSARKQQYISAAGSVEISIRHGELAEQIIEAGASFDLIVMSTHGRGAAGRMIFGSVSDRVVRYGTTPTLLVRRDDSEKEHEASITRLVVALDGSELAEHALTISSRIATILNVPMHLVRVVSMEDVLATLRTSRLGVVSDVAGESMDDPYEQARRVTQHAASEYLDGIRTRLVRDSVAVTTEVRGGTPVFELLSTVLEDNVVVLTSRGVGGFQRWRLGSTAERLVREARCPVLLVPIQDEGAPPRE